MGLTFQAREGAQKQGLNNLCLSIKSYLGDKNLQIVEIGSYCGASGEIIAKNFPNSTLNCVDPWEKYVEEGSTYDLDRQELELKEAEGIFDKVMSQYNNVKKNKMSSIQYASSIEDESIDFVYIDGNHQYTSIKEDLEVWGKKIKKGGIISGHDFGWEMVAKALKEFFNEDPKGIFADGSWFYFKK
jgi:predicted O-methyltransferase YrrM